MRDLAEASSPSAVSSAVSSAGRTHGTTSPAPRLHWIDWLRVAAIAGVFLYHSLRPFDATDWHVKNAETTAALGGVMAVFWSFGLAVLFLASGAGARFALRRRTWRTFLGERTARLLVPFVAGTLLLSPVQGFIEATHKGEFAGSFVDYLGVWLGGLAGRLDDIASPTFSGVGYHLWFLGFLFAMSVITLPLLEWLMGRRGRRTVDALAGMVSRPGATLGFALPIGLLMTIGVLLGTDDHDWFEFAWYSGYFLIGFLFLSDDRFLVAVRRDGPLAAVIALASTVILVATPVNDLLTSMADGLDVPHVLAGVLFAIEGWAWTLVILNVGMRAARLQRPVSPRLGDAVLPVYVIHQPVILAVAFLVVQWPVGILPKWIVVFGMSLTVTLALVELGLRGRVTRVLLGAHARPSPRADTVPARGAGVDHPAAAPTVGAHHARPR
jgi:peptidoglycan/LPS O-acetylase OafA/YrhL